MSDMLAGTQLGAICQYSLSLMVMNTVGTTNRPGNFDVDSFYCRPFFQLFSVLALYAKKLKERAVAVVGPTLSMPKKTAAAAPASAFLCMFAYDPPTYS